MKIQLINPNVDVGKNYVDGVYWPTSLLSIGTYVKKHHPNIEIEILDGPLIGTQEDLENKLDGDLIGITSNTLNYGNVIRTARKAKEKNAKVIVGGPHPTAVGELILRNRPFIDVAVRQAGENAFLKYLENEPLNKIPNLIYRKNKGISSNPVNIDNIALHSELDLELLDLEKYFTKHKKIFPDLPERTVVFFTHFGCKWRDKTEGCSICSIPQGHERLKPKEMWKRIEKLKNEYDIQGIKDYGDDFISDRKWIEELVKTRPKSLDEFVIAGIYASPRYLSEDMADLLKKLNVELVYLGFESGSNEILKLMNKGCTAEQNYISAKRLADRDIGILASYVLGLEGESEKTLSDTYSLAKKVADLRTTELSQAGIIALYPGSRIHRKLIEVVPEYGRTDLFDVEGTRKEWIKHFCKFESDAKAAYRTLEETAHKITDLSPLKSYLGIQEKSENIFQTP